MKLFIRTIAVTSCLGFVTLFVGYMELVYSIPDTVIAFRIVLLQ
ncbi:hypothetical protein [Cohnella abietis]|nr:hypothetical protein [Cohnella abietis]